MSKTTLKEEQQLNKVRPAYRTKDPVEVIDLPPEKIPALLIALKASREAYLEKQRKRAKRAKEGNAE